MVVIVMAEDLRNGLLVLVDIESAWAEEETFISQEIISIGLTSDAGIDSFLGIC